MGQFKPMVKMMTTEPTVELKLKKGGAVAMKKGGSTTKAAKMQMGGVPPMMGAMRNAAMANERMASARPSMVNPPRAVAAGDGMAPAKPSMVDRRSAIGRMADMQAKRSQNKSNVSPLLGRMAAMGKKEGGETSSEHAAEMKKMAGTAKELKEHKSMPASKAHKGLATGGVAMGQGGYKHGGKAKKYAAGGIIKSTSGETKMVTATPDHSPAKTGGVKLGNGGGYKMGGSAKYAKGGGVEGNVSTAHAGVTNTETGGVRKGNAGGYAKGGASKKFARGGSVNDSGKAEAMPQGHKKPSAPVSINRLSGTFKKGGRAEGGPADIADQKKLKAMDKAYNESSKVSSDLEEAMNPLSMMKEAFDKAKGLFKGKPSGESVTKTKESVTVTPIKKRYGGAC